MRAWWGVWSCFVAGTAFAQPPEPDPDVPAPPPETPVETPPEPPPQPPPQPPPPQPPPTVTAAPVIVVETGYPQALAQRPLVLPRGIIEVTAQLVLLRTTFDSDSIEIYSGDGRVRYGIGGADFEAGGQVLIGDSYPEGIPIENETFRSAFVGGRVAVQPELTVGAQLTYVNVSDASKIYQPRLIITSKRRLSPRSAVEIAGFGGIDHQTIEVGGASDSQTIYVVGGELRVQAQVSQVAALEGRAMLSYLKVPDSEFMEGGSGLAQNYGIRLVAAVMPKLDIIGGVDILFSGEANQQQLAIGVAGRLP